MENLRRAFNLFLSIYVLPIINELLRNNYIRQFVDFTKRCLGLEDLQQIEDSFHNKLLEEKYDEALLLAQQYKFLEMDFVYKCKWRNSIKTPQSIQTVLAKIKHKLWTIEECVKTVPVTYEACEALLDFGIKNANPSLLYALGEDTNIEYQQNSNKKDDKNSSRIKKICTKSSSKKEQDIKKLLDSIKDISDEQIEKLIDFEHLNEAQKDLCRFRENLLRYKRSLLVYGKILGSHKDIVEQFDNDFYKDFRQKDQLDACLDFARNGECGAVEILTNEYAEVLHPHYLLILSNIPETICPRKYKNLLSAALKVKALKKHVIKAWFLERAKQIEAETLWPSNAVVLLNLGIEFGIEGLETCRDDFDEFDKIVYDCCTEENILLCYDDFSAMSIIDRLILITGDSLKDCRSRFRFYVLPYLKRREDELKLEGKKEILTNFFYKLANTKEKICRELYSDLLDRIESDDFVASWTEGLDETIDAIGVEIDKIEKERQVKALKSLAIKTMQMEEYDECYESCLLIMKKDYSECWDLCYSLGMKRQFENYEAKYKLLAFSLMHCSESDTDGSLAFKIVSEIIYLRRRDEKLQFEYLRSNKN